MAAPSLKVIVEHQLVTELALQDELTVGRAPGNGLVLDDPAVSDAHGRFRRHGRRWTYTDLGSSQGSLVAAGPRLEAGQGIPLDELTQILVGGTVLEFDPATVAGAEDDDPPVAAPDADPWEAGAATAPDSAGPPPPGRAPRSSSPAGGQDPARPGSTTTTEPPARLVVVLDGRPRGVDLHGPRVLLGSAADCDVVLEHPSVAPRHAELSPGEGCWRVRDLGSAGGTRLGTVRLSGPRDLPASAHLILGAVDLLVLGPAAEGGPALEPRAFLDWLRARRKLTRAQRRQVIARLARGEGPVEELLVGGGVLGPGELVELRHNARAGLAVGAPRRPSTWGLWLAAGAVAGALAWWLLS